MVRFKTGGSVTRLRNLHERIFFAVAACFLLLSALGISFADQRQIAMLAVLVVLLGLPHGALDPAVARGAGLWQTASGLVVFSGIYLCVVVFVIIIWTIASGPALAGFLALSAWHFAGDWKNHLPLIARLSAGVSIVATPALSHGGEVARLFDMLASAAWAATLQEILAVIALPSILLCAVSVLAAKHRSRQAMIEVVMVILLGVMLQPLMYFVVYFCFLHSPRHLIEAATMIGIKSVRSAVTLTSAATLLTVVGAILFFFLMPATSPSITIIQIIFVGLAGLTVPHMLLIERIEHRRATGA